MADIYENAFVTIAATCAANSDDGLRPFGDRFKALRLGSSNFFVREQIYDQSKLYESKRNTNWPLLSRAWAFQESQLAPRTLRFSCHGVIWDCRTTRAEEEKRISGRALIDEAIDLLPFCLPKHSTSGPKKAWHNTVREYSSLDLTYRTDTLPAIAALAQRMARLRRNDTYLAGMWRSTLLSDIQWRVIFDYPHQESGLPTWSWATTRGVVYAADQHTLHSVEILSLDYTPVGPAEIGQIKNAVLTIRGPTLPVQVRTSSSDAKSGTDSDAGFETDSNHYIDFKGSQQVPFWSELEITFLPDYSPSPEFCLNRSQAFLAIFLSGNDETKPAGLILRQIGTVYGRVGWFYLRKVYIKDSELVMEHLAQLPLTTVRII